MPQKPQKTPNQQAYQKELTRIKRFIKSAEKRGYKFDRLVLPQTPKRITKASIEKLKNITPKTLYEQATFYDAITDTIVSGTEEQRLVKQRVAKSRRSAPPKTTSTYTQAGLPPSDVEAVLDNVMDILKHVEDEIAKWTPLAKWYRPPTEKRSGDEFVKIKEKDKNRLNTTLQNRIAHLTRDQVAKNLAQHASEVKELVWQILYGKSGKSKDEIEGEFTRMTNIINGAPVTAEEAKSIQNDLDKSEGGYEIP